MQMLEFINYLEFNIYDINIFFIKNNLNSKLKQNCNTFYLYRVLSSYYKKYLFVSNDSFLLYNEIYFIISKLSALFFIETPHCYYAGINTDCIQ